MSPVTRSKGYVPDTHDLRTQKLGDELMGLIWPLKMATPSRIPRSYSLETFEAPIMDQGSGNRGTSSCTGHGSSQGLYTSFAAAGQPLGFVPSPLGIYRLGRLKGLPTAGQILRDVGAMPAFVMQGLNEYGIQPMGPFVDGRYSDVSVDNVNVKPSFLDLQIDAKSIVTGEYRIDSQAADAITQICTCISQGIAVGDGFAVDEGFENWAPASGPLDLYDPTKFLGNHWIVYTSYDNYSPDAPEKTVLRGPNSWSRSWGSSGHLEITGARYVKTSIDTYPFVARRA